MKRSKRLETVGRLMHQTEQECAVRVTSAHARLAEAERRGQELKRYLKEYQEVFQQRAKAGMGVSGMRDYQLFIARIGEALRQQDAIVSQLRSDWDRARVAWRQAATRKSSVGKVIATARSEDRQLEERRVQKESDERAQRLPQRLGGVR